MNLRIGYNRSMDIEWFKNKAEGKISLYPYHILVNVSLKPYLENVDFVRVGVTKDDKLIIQPVKPQDEERVLAEGEVLLPLSHKKTADRFGNAAICRHILQRLDFKEGDCPIKMKCVYEEEIGLIAEKEEGGYR